MLLKLPLMLKKYYRNLWHELKKFLNNDSESNYFKQEINVDMRINHIYVISNN